MGNKKEQDVIVEDKSVAKVCKKCGDPLRSKSKHSTGNCRRQRAKTRRDFRHSWCFRDNCCFVCAE